MFVLKIFCVYYVFTVKLILVIALYSHRELIVLYLILIVFIIAIAGAEEL
jgi:hypothetical protein